MVLGPSPQHEAHEAEDVAGEFEEAVHRALS
jgi:hypothetical protein